MTTTPPLRLNRWTTWRLSAPAWQQTLFESVMLVVFVSVLGWVLVAAHLDVLLSVHRLHKARSFSSELIYGVLIAPLLEEALFRGFPIALMRWARAQHYTWVIGTLSSVGFALMHTSGSGFHFPLIQFLFGLTAWRMATRRGLRHSIFLHFFNNLSFMLLIPVALVVVHSWLSGF
ncbi:CPBP family intramembrane glutamic endopeptidase [Deinococcus sp.]|uniref:CPBP family intramembrane glutamic endopeptidase n=1 Tax=Deinococcus sp. TaxID=47478 RepID=UPI0025E814D7|nr:CPBP family intramembrane glutamic endopeptidase [Deinococcus sp.]